jgi:glycosyltransferase involved in cell wall biosynthesis
MVENIDAAEPRRFRIGRIIRKGFIWCSGEKKVNYGFGTLLHRSDAIIVLCDDHRSKLLVLEPELSGKMSLIPPPPIMQLSPASKDVARKARRALGVDDDEFLLVYFGRIYPGKGIETLLEAFAMLSHRRKGIRLAFIGGGIDRPSFDERSYFNELLRTVTQLGIEPFVRWTGEYAWDTDEGSVYLRGADMCVLPFDNGVQLNNSSVACVAAHGLAIITTEAQTSDHVFCHGENVFFCRSKNPQALADAIETVLDNGELRGRLQAGALKLAHEWFSWEAAVDRILALLD